MAKFCRFELRTTDVAAARAFYPEILGHDRALISQLPEQALARGAKPHWLGSLGVEDPALITRQFVERGATPLGPTLATPERGQLSVLRDPGGAVLAISSLPLSDLEPEVQVVYHVLNTRDVARAEANYCELFGWSLEDVVDLGEQGRFQQFAWHAGGKTVGAWGEIAGRPSVHPQWLFFFEVSSLETAISATRSAGGLAFEPLTLPSGSRTCVCDDPQGAAFALLERR